MYLPAYSSDLNHCEWVWKLFKDRWYRKLYQLYLNPRSNKQNQYTVNRVDAGLKRMRMRMKNQESRMKNKYHKKSTSSLSLSILSLSFYSLFLFLSFYSLSLFLSSLSLSILSLSLSLSLRPIPPFSQSRRI